ncbi:ABC transporter ATP-binding protein/permease [Vagococcus sp.]|uniref:ABC transporter ATP-binding protein/permease n=1 Tax=Vagococcus sp. TaxID=1933889 RepID=UPI003F9E23CA
MINQRLLGLLQKDKKYLWGIVLTKWLMLIANLAIIFMLIRGITHYFETFKLPLHLIVRMSMVVVVALIVKSIANYYLHQYSHAVSRRLRLDIRKAVLTKSTEVGISQHQKLGSSELTQLSVEGVEQLENYFARFIPQLFYSLLSTFTVFLILAFMYLKPALVLLVCIPLIPISIMAIMKIAKRVLGNYWDGYLILGEQFYENLMGLTTLKVLNQDQNKQKQMDRNAESFRKATMRLLSMQLNSLIVMDIVAYGGAALGIFLALRGYSLGAINFAQTLTFILLASEFFIPLRQLGAFFHVAMNGISASKRLFDFLDTATRTSGVINDLDYFNELTVEELTFSYNENEPALEQINTRFEKGKVYGVIGHSGSGKSTLSKILSGDYFNYEGTILIDQTNLNEFTNSFYEETFLVVNQKSYLFEGTIKDNLLMGDSQATDDDLWRVLEQVHLTKFVQSLPLELNETIKSNGAAFSGGQKQRFIVARALLAKKKVYVFDEVTSSVDHESEVAILRAVQELSYNAIVIFISHRIYTVQEMDWLIVLNKGKLAEQGKPGDLYAKKSLYYEFVNRERALVGEDLYNERNN